MSATLQQFALASDAAAATTKKLAKQKILGEYFRAIESDGDLRIAVRFSAGRAFASTDERVLGASGAIVTEAAMALWKIDYADLRAAAIRRGELGEALADLFQEARGTVADSDEGAGGNSDADGPHPNPLPDYRERGPEIIEIGLTLGAIAGAFDQLAATGNQQAKREIVAGLFAACVSPREVAYLAKIIFSDLRTGVREGVLQAAVAEAFGKTVAEIQHAQFLIGNLDDVAVLAKHDRLAEAAFTLFHPLQFMLATPKETAGELLAAFAGRTFWADDKLDGIRGQIHKDGDRVALYTRTMDRIDDSFPEVVAAVRRLPGSFLLDGEIVAFSGGAVLSFAHLQQRLVGKNLSAKTLREHPAAFIAFDLLARDGELLMNRPLRERRGLLRELAGEVCDGSGDGSEANDLSAAGCGRLSGSAVSDSWLTCGAKLMILNATGVTSEEDIVAAFGAARERLNEGLVLKDPDSRYSPGRRGQLWFKLKTHLPTLDCVVTAAEYGHGKRRGVLSDYTFAVWTTDPADENAKLVNIGKAYSGVTDEEIRQLTELFKSIATSDNGRVFQVRPQVVLEIAMDQLQKSARHASGFSLRFPRIKRIRWDKSPADADRLERVREIYASRENITRKDEPPPVREPGLFDAL